MKLFVSHFISLRSVGRNSVRAGCCGSSTPHMLIKAAWDNRHCTDATTWTFQEGSDRSRKQSRVKTATSSQDHCKCTNDGKGTSVIECCM
jgi:hypothetical protein